MVVMKVDNLVDELDLTWVAVMVEMMVEAKVAGLDLMMVEL